ncbi:MAG TPA: polysaccharide deacetylase family protein [Cyclobacteriaceae bacterium]
MKKVLLLLIALAGIQSAHSQQSGLPERLGYPAGTKLLIVHADDIGVSHSQNAATFEAFAGGLVSSGSILVPCPWFPEIAEYARNHPAADLGIHLTLTSEWNLYKWGPVAPREKVPSLVDDKGFLYADVATVVSKGKPADVETELRAQIERAKKFGIDPTHFDSHMGTLFSSPEFLKIYIELGREYKVPVMLINAITSAYPGLANENDVIIDQIFIASPADYKNGMKAFYTKTLKSIPPGVSCLIIHTAHDNAEMQAVTKGFVDYGSAWRQADLDFFTSETCRQILREEKIQLITWKEIRDKLLR